MTLRTRLALVLVALVVVPLVAAGVLVLYAVPRATAARADALVTGAKASVTDELRQQCDRVSTAALVTGRMLATDPPAKAAGIAVRDGLADWVGVVNDGGNTLAGAGQFPEQVVTSPWPECTAGESGGPAITSEQEVVVTNRSELSAVRAAQSVDTAYLDSLKSRLGFTGDVVLMSEGDIVAASSDPSVDQNVLPDLVAASRSEGGVVTQGGATGSGDAVRTRNALRPRRCHGNT